MARFVVDIETASACDLSACGSWVYGEHESTEILCLAYADADGSEPPKIWRCDSPNAAQEWADVTSKLLAAEKLIAHNASFERDVLSVKNQAFGERGRWMCTAMLCGCVGMPRSLKDACRALCLPTNKQKDARGVRLIGMFSIKSRKSYKTPRQDPAAFTEMCEYCQQDVVAEREIYQLLRDFTDESFLQQWELDCQITDNGVPIDEREARGAAIIYDKLQDEAEARCLELTSGAPMRSTKALREWTVSQGWPLDSFAAAAVDEALENEYMCNEHPTVAEFLYLRKAASGTAGKKYAAILSMLAADRRCHGILVGRAAHTGRYAGRGLQPQNLPRGNFDKHLLPVIREIAKSATTDPAGALLTLEAVAGPQSCSALAAILRDCIAPQNPDECFVVSDYSAIEARVLAWISGEKWVEDIFAGDGKIYERTAAAMYGKSIDSITKHERMAGKIATLALGYGGGIGALKRMAAAYGVQFDDGQAQNIVDTWRASRPATVKFWENLNKMIMTSVQSGCASVQTPHATIGAKRAKIANRNVVAVELPSKRKIYYWNPQVVRIENGRNEVIVEAYGAASDNYAGITPEAEGAHNSKLYGGKLCENIVQAIAFDLLLNSLLKLNTRGLRICFHVHDEIVIQCRRADADKVAETMAADMTATPAWAQGLVLATEPEIMERYRK